MNGTAPQTPKFELRPFGIDMGPFEKQSEYYKFCSPKLVATRTKILDYFASQHDTVREDHIIFRFDHSMEMGFESQLLKQVCAELNNAAVISLLASSLAYAQCRHLICCSPIFAQPYHMRRHGATSCAYFTMVE